MLPLRSCIQRRPLFFSTLYTVPSSLVNSNVVGLNGCMSAPKSAPSPTISESPPVVVRSPCVPGSASNAMLVIPTCVNISHSGSSADLKRYTFPVGKVTVTKR